ncbi:substrate-binding domain-containing protein [Acetivibrio clariflavus]|uniref:substrate-binding domain-containing protein n=1 Tax=Acetivibrio clariflavus TaxID=288965 RepID=UPI0004884D68|nr:substrate-binding domain-containing protein [Acetivibrio clariflavus]
MKNARQSIRSKNIIKSILFSIVAFLFVFVTLTILALLLGTLSGISLRITLTAALIFEALGFIILLTVLFKFFRSIDSVNNKVQLLASGELKADDILKEDSFGLEVLTVAFNDMKSNLLNFISLTKVNVITISDAIDNLSKSMDRSYMGNKRIAASMENVAERANDQAKLMGDAMAGIDEVKNRIEIITESIEKFEKSVEESVRATASGVENLEEYYKQVNIISDNLNSTSEYIKKLNADITQIDNIGKLIAKTSEQLKLLGLNASVEAAKAGESGKGFSVVAHEMNLLSAATKESVSKISEILKKIQNRSGLVSKSIDECVESYDVSKDIFKSIKQSFDIIYNNANILEADIKKVHNEANLINSSAHEINEKSQELYKISEDISNKTNEVSAVTQEELEELQKIHISSSSLSHMLEGFEILIEKFNTSVVPVDADSDRQLRIAFICPLDNEFWFVIRKGVLYAKKELAKKNVAIDFYGIEEDVGPQLRRLVKEAIDNNVNGIIVPGFDPLLAELIEQAYQKNIPVMTFNIDLPVESKRIAYFGPDIKSTGTVVARIMAKALDGKGEVAFLTAEGDDFGRESTLAELKKYRGIKVAAQASCADNIELSYATIKDLLTRNSNIRAISVYGAGLYGAVRAVEELGLVGKTLIISCFYNKDIAEYIKKGVIYAAISHDPFGQAHDAVIHLYNMLVTGQRPESDVIWANIEIINKNNIYDLL